jgi:hypothetical protein
VLWLLANVGFKDAAVGRMRQDFVPVSNVEVQVRVPEGRQVKSIELLRAKRTARFTMQGDYVIVSLPIVHIAEVLHVVLA